MKSRATNYQLLITNLGLPFALFAFFAVIIFVVVGCASSTEIKPPEIAYGRDLCDACGMIIGDARFAAATLMTDGKTLKFDDVGEMLMYHAKHPELNVRAWFVHDYNTKAWVRGEESFYVMSRDKIKSPMGMGVAAFADRAAADAFAKEIAAQVMTFEQAQRSVK